MHWFSTDAFLGALAEASFPGRPARPSLFRSEGRVFRLLGVEGEPPIVEWPFLDFLVPLEGAEAEGPVGDDVHYLPHVALESAEIGGKPELVEGTEPAPYIVWSRFPDWRAFEAHFATRRSSLIRDSRTKRRNLEKDLGALRFLWEDPRPEVFERCVAWKAAQYDRTGVVNLFLRPESAQLFRVLHARGSLVISSLSAGDTLLAVHFGGLEGGRLYSWIASYDPERSRYSPGRLLLEDMLRESLARGHSEWDFGIGDMDYKWHYATHNRVIAPLGSPSLSNALGRAATARIKRVLQRYPALFERARRFRKRIKEVGRGP